MSVLETIAWTVVGALGLYMAYFFGYSTCELKMEVEKEDIIDEFREGNCEYVRILTALDKENNKLQERLSDMDEIYRNKCLKIMRLSKENYQLKSIVKKLEGALRSLNSKI